MSQKVFKMELRPEDQLILSVIKLHPSPVEMEQINGLIPLVKDWDYLINTIINRGIGPLLYKKLALLTNSTQIPKVVKTKLQQVWYKTFSRSTVLYEHFRKIAEAFTSQNIPVIALKGIYLSEWLYEDIGLRQFSDIDLLVKEEYGDKCLAILAGMGYKPSKINLSKFVLSQFEKDMVHYPPMILDGVSIEIHIKLHQKKEKYDLIVAELWKNAIHAILNGVSVSALNNQDLLIHLCLHLDKHFRIGHVQFTCFNDITNLLEKYSDTLDWEKLTASCRLYKCEEIVYLFIVMIHNYMHATVPIAIIDKYGYLLTQKDEQLFCKYLKGSVGNDSNVMLSGHFEYMKNTQNLSEKIRYIRDVLFPSKSFMLSRYQIKYPSLVMFYYPYRCYIGIRGVVNHIFSR